jgi:16S rRNA (uracil1498-N3)-methyltransferase
MDADLLVPLASISHTREGSIITVIDSAGREKRGRVLRINGENAVVRTFEELPLPSESPLLITLIQAIPKKEKMGFIVQKATELGVAKIIPCTTERSEAPEKEGVTKSHRWPTVAAKAVEQCRRRIIPSIASICSFQEALESISAAHSLKVILDEKERTVCLKDLPCTSPEAIVVCGPEGGFTTEEVQFARQRGFVPVRLGGRILRCETAALAALAIVQHRWGDL